MELISPQQRTELLWGGSPTDVLKLELHDHYDVDRELFEAWRDGNTVVVEQAKEGHRESLAGKLAEGWGYRRLRVVSEPLSDYQKMAVEIANPVEQLRWLPRPRVSAVPLPGNDCLIRHDLVIFNLMGGANQQTETQLSRDPGVIRFCWESFEEAWQLAVPNGEYKPA